jgi:hypothetical protein
MGGIKECYLHFKNAGDQYLGRVVAGLDCNEYLFAVSPPYFDLSTVANEEETEKNIDQLVADGGGIPKASAKFGLGLDLGYVY